MVIVYQVRRLTADRHDDPDRVQRVFGIELMAIKLLGEQAVDVFVDCGGGGADKTAEFATVVSAVGGRHCGSFVPQF